jgi:thiamine-monophosphate kinase
MTSLGAGKEFDLIREMLSHWGDVAKGIGDDAAVLSVPRGDQLVVSVDTSVIGRHFRAEWLTPTEIGYRATAAALSDLAAMAATPLGVLTAINLPTDWEDRLPEIAEGIGDAARSAKAAIIGGNISGAEELSVTVTVLGHCFKGVARSGARVGDRIYVTGSLGGPGAAVKAWNSGSTPAAALRERFAHPVPRIREAQWLADRGMRSCIDVSDGVAADAGHLAAASGHTVEIHLERLPYIEGASPIEAMASGEEYELLLSAPTMDVAEFKSRFGIELTEIGAVVEGAAEARLMDHGARVSAPLGFDHFAR